ncbi:MAG: RpiB/LacA/LacB family sugar-phosphate isomerase [Patescibacteria group bacterium]|nr:RpiB/LacA/LacB family sugar-phosphate isomerase [Patescibacteria group bacterium]
MPKIYFAADHAGFDLKTALVAHVRTLGYDVEDMGASVLNSEDDYPDFITPCARRVAEENARTGSELPFRSPGAGSARGIIIGGSGQGEAMAANRVPGIRAAVFYGPMRVTAALDIEGGHSEDGYDAVRLARRHNDANMLSIGARFVGGQEADEAVRIFLETPFSGAERHRRRLAKF